MSQSEQIKRLPLYLDLIGHILIHFKLKCEDEII
jgi:hypothetical protein